MSQTLSAGKIALYLASTSSIYVSNFSFFCVFLPFLPLHHQPVSDVASGLSRSHPAAI